MHQFVPDLVAREGPVELNAEQLLDVAAHAAGRTAELRRVDVDRRGDLLEERLVGGLGFERPALGLARASLEVVGFTPVHWDVYRHRERLP
jgi:hypothetical protein